MVLTTNPGNEIPEDHTTEIFNTLQQLQKEEQQTNEIVSSEYDSTIAQVGTRVNVIRSIAGENNIVMGNQASDQKVEKREKYRLENLTSAEITPEMIQEFSDFYREIFSNTPYSQFLLDKKDPLRAISPQEAFGQPDKKYFSLEELNSFQLPEGSEFWVDPQKNKEMMEHKLRHNAYVTRMIDNETGKLIGMVLGRQATLKDVFESEEMKNPLKLSRYFDPELLDNDDRFFSKMKYHCGVEPETEVFSVPVLAISPEARGIGTLFKILRELLDFLPPKVLDLLFFAEIESSGAAHDLDIACSEREIFGILKNGHAICASTPRTYSKNFGQDPTELFGRIKEYKKWEKTYKPHEKDNPKVELREAGHFGKGVFAREKISLGEVIAEFVGEKYQAPSNMSLPSIMVNHVIQVGKTEFVHAHHRLVEKINHSCEPNCGLRNSTEVVALRDIAPGEELNWDYRMSEDSDWEMDCQCGSPTCSGKVGNFKNLEEEKKNEYLTKGAVSPWLIEKYGLKGQ